MLRATSWGPDPDIPRVYYILLIGRFFNLVGNSLVFPFMTIYLASRLHASLSVVGVVMAFYGASQVISVLVGGVWSDRFGRRLVMLGSLLLGALVTFGIGLVHNSWLLITLLTLMGFFMPLFQPASMAMVGDIISRDRLNYAYSLMRMASNAGIIIGPMLGGLLADHSFFWIFALDALSMLLFSLVIFFAVPESRPVKHSPSRQQGHMKDVLRDQAFVHFAGLWALTGLVYSQLFMVVPAYLHINLGYPPSVFGYLAAENAIFVVLLQIPITRLTRRISHLTLMAVGVFFYALGFWLMLSGRSFAVFALAVFVITLGENFINPAASAWVAERAPEIVRGRYMGFFSVANRVGAALGPLFGGILLSQGPQWWLITTGILALLAAQGYWRFRHHSYSSCHNPHFINQ
ncbi:MDR family MFS transporter [Sulfobacillus thermosulfidooxidans]|uniref:MDR family MFS transporter n=1 Tax=Sulfobacillus thermosulfidooxidans TaxID=28034 RepID=UPI0002FE612E|nr:MFS transporter [Sulfobacillus thermosulfidooxidans]